jgi:hypothetical protein
LGDALRSLVEPVACLKLIERRNYLKIEEIQNLYGFSEKLSQIVSI